MAQVQTPREFKFVGGPSRKRRRNGTLAESRASSSSSTAAAAAAKQAKRSCRQPPAGASAAGPAATPARTHHGRVAGPPASSSYPGNYHHNLLSSPDAMPLSMPSMQVPPPQPQPQPSRRSSSGLSRPSPSKQGGAGLINTTDFPPGPLPAADLPGQPFAGYHHATPTGGLPAGFDGILDWSGSDDSAIFENALFSDPSLFAEALLGLSAGEQPQPQQQLQQQQGDAVPPLLLQTTPMAASSPAMTLPPSPALLSPSVASAASPAFSSPASGLSSLSYPSVSSSSQPTEQGEPDTPPPPDSASRPSRAASAAHVPHPYLPLVFLDAHKQPYIAAENLLVGTAPRLYTQPSALYDTMTRIFFQYDQEFCILPLTYDFTANPFRYNLAVMQHAPLLRHCILAVSYRHVDHDTGACTSEAGAYKRRATQMLLERMPTDGATTRDPTLLDATTVLMTLDCATSALGPWRAHLQRARRLLQSTPAALSPQRRAQIGMLAWIDVTRALTSRNGCILPESTILRIFDEASEANTATEATKANEATENPGSSDTDNTPSALEFYAISGCPRELFQCMVRLAAYARELRVAATMACVRFDLAPVLAIERRIACWQSPAFGDPVAQPQGLLDLVTGRGRGRGSGRGSGRGRRPPRRSGRPATNPDDATDTTETNETNDGHHRHRPPRNKGLPGQHADPGELDYRLDLYHCAEAWRYALLVYINRVFKCPAEGGEGGAADDEGLDDASEAADAADGNSTTGSSSAASADTPPSHGQILQLLARRTLTHVNACRRSTYVQKQLLLPVFLAAAEVRDASLRSDASEFCVWWAAKTRYNMFITVRALLEEVWRRQGEGGSRGGGEQVWWGEVFDQQSRKGEKEYLLG